MKIETNVVSGVLDGKSWCFFDNQGQDIPVGTKVTVEWGHFHQCEKLMKHGSYSLRLGSMNWWLQCGHDPWFIIVDYCPGCGMKMGD